MGLVQHVDQRELFNFGRVAFTALTKNLKEQFVGNTLALKQVVEKLVRPFKMEARFFRFPLSLENCEANIEAFEQGCLKLVVTVLALLYHGVCFRIV